MKSYAESKGKKPFDWNEFFAKKTYTERELRKASALANGWVTCACGTMCNILERTKEGVPQDDKLENLGSDFGDAVYEMMRKFVAIEELTVSIKKEEKSSHPTYYLDEWKHDLKGFKKAFELHRKIAIKTLERIEKRSAELLAKKLDSVKVLAQHFGFKLVKRKS